MNEYDFLIIGSGPAGYTAAFEAAGRGMRAAIIERDPSRLGGVCLGEGCIPLKGFLYHTRYTNDYFAIRDRVMERVSFLREGLRSRLKSAGVAMIEGEARFASAREVEADGKIFAARHMLIAVGSVPRRIFHPSLALTSDRLFALQAVPESALVIGGGVVGCEYASFFAAIGVRVDIVEILDSPLGGEDEEAVRVMIRAFRKKGIGLSLGTRVEDVDQSGTVRLAGQGGTETRRYDAVFEAAGRRPATEGLNCAAAGIELDDKGFIKVDAAYRTTAPGIYAAGDCINTPMFAYAAAREAEAAVRHAVTGEVPEVDYGSMPRVVFSSPQVGGVGLTEREASSRGISYRLYRRHFRALGKAVVEGRDDGFVKILVRRDSGEVIGASAAGEEIADVMNLLSVAVRCRLTADQIRTSFFIHPSYSEILLEAIQYGGSG